MATLTYTITNRGKFLGGGMRVNLVNVAMSGNYTALGEPLSPSKMGMSKIDAVVCTAAPGFLPHYDKVNGKLQFFETGTTDATLDELNATTLPAVLTNTVQLIVIGR